MADVQWWHFALAFVWLVLWRIRRGRIKRGADLGVGSGAGRDLLGRGGF